MDDGHLSSLIPEDSVTPSMDSCFRELIYFCAVFLFVCLKSSQVGRTGWQGSGSET